MKRRLQNVSLIVDDDLQTKTRQLVRALKEKRSRRKKEVYRSIAELGLRGIESGNVTAEGYRRLLLAADAPKSLASDFGTLLSDKKVTSDYLDGKLGFKKSVHLVRKPDIPWSGKINDEERTLRERRKLIVSALDRLWRRAKVEEGQSKKLECGFCQIVIFTKKPAMAATES